LLVELTHGVCVRLCLASFYRPWGRSWTARHPILALIVHERLKPFGNLLPEVVVHVLHILQRHGELRSGLLTQVAGIFHSPTSSAGCSASNEVGRHDEEAFSLGVALARLMTASPRLNSPTPAQQSLPGMEPGSAEAAPRPKTKQQISEEELLSTADAMQIDRAGATAAWSGGFGQPAA
jgi:hypothetical protein